METFKICNLSVLSSVFLSYVFSNNFLCAFHELQPIPKHPALLESSSGPGFDLHQRTTKQIEVK